VTFAARQHCFWRLCSLVVVADWNGDQKPDLAITKRIRAGSGISWKWGRHVRTRMDIRPRMARLDRSRDLNGDHHMDMRS